LWRVVRGFRPFNTLLTGIERMSSQTDAPANGHRFGDFAIGREIGRGGMGVVYEARQISLNRKVALKVLASELGLTPKSVDRFRLEAEAAAKLHHTNIVPIYATGEHDGAYFYAMEFIEGASLDHVLRQLRQQRERTATNTPPAAHTVKLPSSVAQQAALTAAHVEKTTASSGTGSSSALSSGSGYFDTVARIIADVADALDHAHKHGVIHRDIKPSNLLLCVDGRLSVNDFGLARMLEKPGMTITGEFVGTPAYMSPEQITAGRVPLDHRTDIYSLGATLYELLTLQRPFRGEGRDQVLAQILQKDPVPPRKIDKKVPVDLETICLKAMEKDPDRRYASAAAMAEDLRRYVNRFAILARRAGPVARAFKWIRRHRAVSMLAAGLLVAVAAAGIFGYLAHVARKEREDAERKRLADARQRVAEKQQSAIDKAQLSAMSGDFDQAKQSLDEAERLGVSTVQVHLLRGQIAFYKGDLKEAVKQFNKAVALQPQSVAARASLAMAYLENCQWELFDQTLSQAHRLTPDTAEDYLYLGKAQSMYHPHKAMQLLDKAIQEGQKGPSLIAHLCRADVLLNLARDGGDADLAQQAAEEADLVKKWLPDNPVALRTALEARTIAIYAYQLAGQAGQRDAAIALARKDAEALKRFPHYASALLTRWQFHRALGEQDSLLDEMEKSELPGVTELYVLTLYRRGEFDKARTVMARDDKVGPMYVCLVLSEFPDGPAKMLERYYAEAQKPETPKWALLTNQLVFLVLGQWEKSRKTCLSFRDQGLTSPVKDAEMQRALLYLCGGKLSAEDYLKDAGASRVDQTNAHYFVGLTHLAKGNRPAAREHFRKVVQTGAFSFDHYELSWAMLGRLEQSRRWPPRIPAKE
jgi:serine/threonine protein kinase/tetratricopeptide (TPR) repeat protein